MEKTNIEEKVTDTKIEKPVEMSKFKKLGTNFLKIIEFLITYFVATNIAFVYLLINMTPKLLNHRSVTKLESILSPENIANLFLIIISCGALIAGFLGSKLFLSFRKEFKVPRKFYYLFLIGTYCTTLYYFPQS